MFPAWPASTFPSGASRPIPPATILSIPAHNPQQANSLPPGLAGRRLTFLPTTFLTSTKHHLPTKYRSPPFFHSSSFFHFSIFYIASNILPAFIFSYLQLQSHPTTFPIPSTSSVLLPLLQPAGQTRNVVSRAGAACKAADGAGEEPAFLFSFFFYFFLLLSFLSSFPSPWRRGFAATPSFFFLLFFIFLFFLFVLIFAFLFAFFFLIFSLYFSSYFLFLFFLCPFFLLFFLVFIFDSPFLFCLSFCFTFLPFSLQFLSLLSNRSPTIHFFLFRRQSLPFPPATSRQQ